MVGTYNLYLGGFLPKVPAKSAVHKKSELKEIYNNIVNLNKQSPLVMVNFSDKEQAYALDVKGMAMELQVATGGAADVEKDPEEREASLKEVTDIFNRLLTRSDDFALQQGRPSRPGGELRNLVFSSEEELTRAGFEIDDSGYLKGPKEVGDMPQEFLKNLEKKSEYMSRNLVEYVDKKVYSYAFLANRNIGTSYGESVYSGMLFNSYC